jgi:hypothetical protein
MVSRAGGISELLSNVPLEPATIEDRARHVLIVLAEAIANAPVQDAIKRDPRSCPNCGQQAEAARKPYCSEECKCMAAFIRQFRNAVAQRTLSEPDRQVSLGQGLWFLLGGGRPLRLEIAPPRALEQAIRREGGKCQACGAEATTVDHVGSG